MDPDELEAARQRAEARRAQLLLQQRRAEAEARRAQLAAGANAPRLDLRRRQGESRDDYRARIEAARPYVQPNAETQLMDQMALEAMDMRPAGSLPDEPAIINKFLRPAIQGATLGFGDEITARLASISPSITYENALAYDRAQLARASEEAPWLTTGMEIVGGLGTAALAAPAMAGAGLARQALTMGGIGAAEGAVYGFGTGEGGIENRARNALLGGAIGGGVGAVAPIAIAGAQAVARPFVGGVRSALGVGSNNRAASVIARTLSRAGMTQDQVINALNMARAEGQDVFTAADAMGNAGQRALAGVARAPGEGRQRVQEYLLNRQLGQADRLGGFVNDALGLSDETAAQVRAAAAAQRSGDASVNYPAADAAAQPVDLTQALSLIDGRLGPMDQGGIRATPIGQAFQRYRSMLEVPTSRLPPGVTNMALSDFRSVLDVKQALSDDISAALRAGRNQEASALIPLRQALDEALEQASPLYRQANDTFRRQSQVIDAVQTGQDTARANMRADDAVARYNALAQPPTTLPVPSGPLVSPQQAFRVGYGDQMLARMENVTPTTNAALPFTTPRQQALMGQMAQDADLWRRRLDREIAMAQTRGAATGGSQTADNLADQADVAGNVGAISSILTGNVGAAAQQVGTRLVNAAAGMDEQTRAILARALLSNDPQGEFARLFQIAQRQGTQQRSVEAFARHSGYQGLPDQ